jgi:hypothetical protein
MDYALEEGLAAVVDDQAHPSSAINVLVTGQPGYFLSFDTTLEVVRWLWNITY